MHDRELRREARRFRRYRSLRTNDPYCRICGKGDWRIRYERHHISGRAYEALLPPDILFICGDCHDKIGDTVKDRIPLPPNLPANRVALINRLYGQNEVAEMQIQSNFETIQCLIGDIDPPPIANGNGGNDPSSGDGEAGAEVGGSPTDIRTRRRARAVGMDQLEAWLARAHPTLHSGSAGGSDK